MMPRHDPNIFKICRRSISQLTKKENMDAYGIKKNGDVRREKEFLLALEKFKAVSLVLLMKKKWYVYRLTDSNGLLVEFMIVVIFLIGNFASCTKCEFCNKKILEGTFPINPKVAFECTDVPLFNS